MGRAVVKKSSLEEVVSEPHLKKQEPQDNREVGKIRGWREAEPDHKRPRNATGELSHFLKDNERSCLLRQTADGMSIPQRGSYEVLNNYNYYRNDLMRLII